MDNEIESSRASHEFMMRTPTPISSNNRERFAAKTKKEHKNLNEMEW